MESAPPPSQIFAPNYGNVPPVRRGNGAAIASLVLGILGCVPFLTGILAVIFGIAGIRKCRDPYVSGKGLAVAGLILGVLSVIGWSMSGAFFGYAYGESKPAKAVSQQFLQDVAAGNITQATSNSAGLTSAQLQTVSQQLAPFGKFQSIGITGFHYNAGNQPTMHLDGIATFSNGPKICTFDLVKRGQTYKVTSFWVQ